MFNTIIQMDSVGFLMTSNLSRVRYVPLQLML